ncbi:CARDB domain-containing protein [Corallococcus macrosporus]|uniref:CARDB domain-containing protein n=1 Tax=Corallococcus macrosporus TaxID=35 RepID=UPI0002F109A9|nr:CARDB domain-containing protein [Corallococcus macrosporus]
MRLRRRPSWSGTALLTAGLLVGCGGGADPTQVKGQAQAQGVGPDLVVRDISGPTSVRPGAPFTATVRVCNEGTTPAQPSGGPILMDLYLSMDDALSWPMPGSPPPMDQTLLGTLEVGWPEPGQCTARAFSTQALLPPAAQQDGTFYLGAIVDTQHALTESREDNNTRVRALGVGFLPDLVVTEVSGPASVRHGTSFISEVEVCNQGTQPSPNSAVDLYLSTDDSLSVPGPGAPPPVDQAWVGNTDVPPLDAGQCVTRQVPSATTPPPGSTPEQPLYLGAIVDSGQHESELREDNNVFVGGRIGLGDGPDLVVTSVQAPPNAELGSDFTATVRVCNQGTQSAPPSQVELHFSADSDISMPGPGGVPPDQLQVGMTDVPPLSPGDCAARALHVVAGPVPSLPEPGPVTLAAIVDAHQQLPELREDNNVFVGGDIGLGLGPDLVVTAMRAPPSVRSWGAFMSTVTVCNQGTAAASHAELGLYLSMAPTLDAQEMNGPPSGIQSTLMWRSVSPLEPGQCITQDIMASVVLPEDAPPEQPVFHLGAFIDAHSNVQELREDNNAFVHGLVGVGERPDLVVTELRAPASVASGPFAVTARVCNQGTQPAGHTDVVLFLSTHDTLSPPIPGSPYPYPDPSTQVPIGGLPVPPLEANTCITVQNTVSVHVPGMPGNTRFYLGGVIDAADSVDELRDDNNAFVGGAMGVGHGPDLVITAVTTPANVRKYDDFIATVRVCNQGTQPSSGTQAELYLSTEDHLRMPDWNTPGSPFPWSQSPIGGVSVPPLSPGHCLNLQAQAHAHPPPDVPPNAAVYVGAIIDTYQGEPELREDNNTFVSGRIGVGDGPDLVITAITAPPSVMENDEFTATVTLCNQGTAPSFYTEVELYLSTQAHVAMPQVNGPGPIFPDTQRPIGGVSVSHLAEGQCETRAFMAWGGRPYVATPGQPLYVGAAVDGWRNVEELREDNNTFVSGRIGVGNGPDLVVTEVQAPPSVLDNDTFTATVTVCNQGTNMSGSTHAELHFASEPVLAMPDFNNPGVLFPPTQVGVGGMSVPPLPAGRCFTGDVTATAQRPPGAQPGTTLYVGALVDGPQYEPELREDNNTFVSGLIGVGHGSDLVVTDITAPASVYENDSFTATVTVCNQGTSSSMDAPLEVHLSTEATLTPYPLDHPGGPLPDSQVRVGYQNVPPLDANDCITLSVPAQGQRPVASQPDQALYLGALIIPSRSWHEAELREDNNTFVSGLIGVGHGADLVVTAITAPPSVEEHEDFTATVTVCNQGTVSSSYTELALYLSTRPHLVVQEGQGPDPQSSDSQRLVGGWNAQPLAPGQCVTSPVMAWAARPYAAEPGQPLYLGAAIDLHDSEPELREDNNTFVSGRIGVGSDPDLVVTSISGPSSVRTGSAFTATVRVCNQGTTSSGGVDVELFMSSDSTLDAPGAYGPGPVAEEQVSIGGVQLSGLAAGQCATRNVSVAAYTPPGSAPTGFFYLGAIVDVWNGTPELREDNNALANRLIMVTP